MTEDERLALIWEASDELGDDPLLLPVLFALRDEGFRRAVTALLNGGAQRRRAMLALASGRTLAAANDDAGSVGGSGGEE